MRHLGDLFLIVIGIFVSQCTAIVTYGKCDLPDCKSQSRDIPGGLLRTETPQMVVVSFDGRLGEGAEKIIRRIFRTDKKNPNECPILSTYFVSNENTNYCSVNRLWAEGHEIGSNGITRHSQQWWQEADSGLWGEEIQGQLNHLEEKAGISKYDIPGWRTPYLQPGGDTQYYSLNLDHDFLFDSTLRTPLSTPAERQQGALWPFTLDHPYSGPNGTFRCDFFPCPQMSHPSLWELPINQLIDVEANNRSCSYLDGCLTLVDNPAKTYNLLHHNFDLHYLTNRAPFLINVRAHWLMNNEEALIGVENFVDDMVTREDVWLVTASMAIRWVQNPQSLGDLDTFRPWGCISKRYLPHCHRMSSRGNSSVKFFPGLLGNTGSLLMWQYIILAVLFVIILRIDKSQK